MAPWLKSNIGIVTIAVVVIVCAGVAGYLVGRVTAPSDRQAAMVHEVAEERARDAAQREAFGEARERGLEAGRREGRRAGGQLTERAESETDSQASSEPSSDPAEQGPQDVGTECGGYAIEGGQVTATTVTVVSCEDAQAVIEALYRGEGEPSGRAVAVSDWTCESGTGLTSCFRDEASIEAQYVLD